MKGPRKASLPVASGNYPVICHIPISLRDASLDLTPKQGGKKANINKWDYINLKSLCTAKEIPSRQTGNILSGGR